MSGVRLKGVRKSFGSLEIIKGVDLDVRSKEFVVFVGPSGCGKSTLLRMIALPAYDRARQYGLCAALCPHAEG